MFLLKKALFYLYNHGKCKDGQPGGPKIKDLLECDTNLVYVHLTVTIYIFYKNEECSLLYRMALCHFEVKV